MAKVIALDVGTKRTGVAETDPMQIIASGLTTINTNELVPFLENYCKTENPETLVVGQPKRLHGEAGSIEGFILGLIDKIQKKIPQLKIERQDERFTSNLAFQAMIDSGLKKKDRAKKELIDQVSATIILQGWLDRNSAL